jgi:small GTP-binding protein
MDREEEIREIEEEISRTKYNKATQKHIGMLKAKLARLREGEELEAKKKRAGAGYSVRKSGDATVLLVGFPSVGKSTLLNCLTNADSKIGHYDFTTLDVIPGVLEYNGAKIQVLDVPGMVEGASKGKGRGKEILSVMRSADLVVIIAESQKPGQIEALRRELHGGGFRLDQEPPDVRITKKNIGGLNIGSAVRLRKVSKDELESVLHEFKIRNAEVVIRQDITVEQFIDCLMGNRVYVPSILVINKSDLAEEGEIRVLRERDRNAVFVSAEREEGIEILREEIWDKLGLMRVYMKRIGKSPDMKEPLIVKVGSSVKDVATKIHRIAFGGKVEYARIWGKSARFPGQKKGPAHVLVDLDVVELHTK